VEERLRRAGASNELIDRITIAGHGEPTLHPEFECVVGRLCAIRDRVAPGIPIAILSNSTTAAWPEVRQSLAMLDERHMKLDAGDPITYSLINGPGTHVSDIVDALSHLRDITIQSMFVHDRSGQIDNATDGAVSEWLRALDRIRPSRVHVYTIGRQPARTELVAVSMRRLREVSEHVRSAGFVAEVFG
jgi:wyosine [tRNA(Phe)-imidazoG37] synthetase (radical SAM superfamily)